MRYRILKELAFSFMVCIGERVLERLLFPGLNLTPGRMMTDDVADAERLSVLLGEALALLAMIWLFAGTLHVIGWLYRRPLHWYVPPLLSIAIVVLTFAAPPSHWHTMAR